MKATYVVGSIILAAAALVFFYSTWSGSEFNFSPSESPSGQNNLIRAGVALAGMMVGILFGSLHRIWRERSDRMSFAVLTESFFAPEIWRSILVSPLVFIGVYIAAQAQPDMILSFFFSFQSGFFSDAIMQGKAKEFNAGNGS